MTRPIQEDTPMTTTPRRLLLAPLLAATLLTGCGGGQADDLATPLLLAGVQVVSPLRDDEGRLTAGDPSALPAEPGLRARLAHHATAAQADQLQAALGSGAIPVRLDSADGAAETAEVWAAAQGCAPRGETPYATVADGKGGWTCTEHADCAAGTSVVSCQWDWTHDWGRDGDDNFMWDAVWAFFEAHPRR
jgi:hypothetical protein